MLYGITASASPTESTGPSGPVILSVTPSGANANVTSQVVSYPAVVAAGDLLLLQFIARKVSLTAPTITPASGWETLSLPSPGSNSAYYWAYKEADGDEGGDTFVITTSVGAYFDAQIVRIKAGTWDPARVPEFGGPESFGFLPALAPSWGYARNLWLAMGLWEGDVVVTSFPLPDNQLTHDSGAGAAQCSTSLCTDTLLSSERPIPPDDEEHWEVSAGVNDSTGLVVVAPPGLVFQITYDSFDPYALNSGLFFTTGVAHAWRGVAPYTFEILSGDLPTGVAFDTATGEIDGVPEEDGEFPITVRCTDSSSPAQVAEVEIVVEVQILPLEVDTGYTLTEPFMGTEYGDQPYVIYGRPPFTFTLQSGSLPAGVTLNAPTGLLYGFLDETTEGEHDFVIRCTDADENYIDIPVELLVAYTALAVVGDYADAEVDLAYSDGYLGYPFAGGRPPYVFTIEDGALPTGLSLNAATSEISGTPTVPGVYTFTIRCTDDDANFEELEDTIEIIEP